MPAGKTRKKIRNKLFAPCRSRHDAALSGSGGLNPPARSVTTRTTSDRAVSPIPPSHHGGHQPPHALQQGTAEMRSRASIYNEALTPSYRSHPHLASVNVPENGLARGALKVRNTSGSINSGASSAYSVKSCCSPQLSTISESNKGRTTGSKASSSSMSLRSTSHHHHSQTYDPPLPDEPEASVRVGDKLEGETDALPAETAADALASTPEPASADDNDTTTTPDSWRRHNESQSYLLKSRADFCRQPVDSPFTGTFPNNIAATAYALIAASESVQELRDALEWADGGDSYCSGKHDDEDLDNDAQSLPVYRATDRDAVQPETAAPIDVADTPAATTDTAAQVDQHADEDNIKVQPTPPSISVDDSVSLYSQSSEEQVQSRPRDLLPAGVDEMFSFTGGAAVPAGTEREKEEVFSFRGDATATAGEKREKEDTRPSESLVTQSPAPTFFAELTFRPAPLRPQRQSMASVEDESEKTNLGVSMLDDAEDGALEALFAAGDSVHDVVSVRETSPSPAEETTQLEELPDLPLTNDDDRIPGPVNPSSSGKKNDEEDEEAQMDQETVENQDHDFDVSDSVEPKAAMSERRQSTSESVAISLPDPDFLIAFPSAESRAESRAESHVESAAIGGQVSTSCSQPAASTTSDAVSEPPRTPDHAIGESVPQDAELISQFPDDVRSLGDHQQSSPDDGSPPLDGRDAPTEGSSPQDDTNPPSDTHVPDESSEIDSSEDQINNDNIHDDSRGLCYYPDNDRASSRSSSRNSEYSSSLNGQTLVEEHSDSKEIIVFPPTDAPLAEARADGAEAAAAAAEEQAGEPCAPATPPQHPAAAADGLRAPTPDQLEKCPPSAGTVVEVVASPTPETPLLPEPAGLDEPTLDTANSTPFPAFFASDTYSIWSSRGGLLRITGAAGAGKSTLMANLVEHFEETMMAADPTTTTDNFNNGSNTIISYTFHAAEPVMVDPGQHARGKPVSGLLHALAHQLAQQEQQQHEGSIVPSELAALYAADDGEEQQQHAVSRWELSEMELQDALLKHARTRFCGGNGGTAAKRQGRRLWVFVDAVDEVGDEEAVGDLLDFFEKLAALPAVGVCVSAKEDDGAGKALVSRKTREDAESGLQVRVEDFNADDIAEYVRGELAFALVNFDAEELEYVSRTVEQRARNIFLWAILAVDMIQRDFRGRTSKEMREAIEQVPTNLDEIYRQRILSVPADERKPCLRLLQWVCFATRPLTLRELRVALALRPEVKSLADVYRAPDYIASDADIADVLHHLSRGLLHVPAFDVHTAPIAAPVHASAKDFLVAHNGLDLLAPEDEKKPTRTTTDLLLSRRLLHYITFREYRDAASTDAATLPLATYATYSWHLHAESAEHHGADQADLLDLLHNTSAFQRWWWCHATMLSAPAFFHPNPPPLDVMDDRLAELLYIQHRRADLTIFDLAAACGLCSTIGAALAAIADTLAPNSKTDSLDGGSSGSERTLLHWAAFSGNEAMVAFFLRRPDVRTAAVDRRGQTALHIAVIQGHARIVRTLVAAMPPSVIDARDEDGRAALHYATLLRDEAVIAAMLENGGGSSADVNVRDASGATPLFAPCKAGDVAAAARFLQLAGPGVDVNARSGSSKEITALLAAVVRRRRGIVKLLTRMRPDLDVNARDINGDTPLALAVRMEDVGTVRILLERDDLDVNARRSSANGGGAAAATSGETNSSPLLTAVSTGNEAVVRALLARPDADVNARGERWRSPLHLAVGLGYAAVVGLLVEQRADLDVNARDEFGCTPLMDAVASGRTDIVAALLRGARKGEVDVLSGFALLVATAEQKGSGEIVRLLQERYHGL